jgi:prephenate dehydrogenase
MKVIEMSPQEHDRAVAVMSHLPYLMGVALTRIGKQTDVAGPSFRSASRIAGSPVDLWTSILAMNRRELQRAAKEFIDELERISRLEGIDLKKALEEARERQRRL